MTSTSLADDLLDDLDEVDAEDAHRGGERKEDKG